MKKWKRWLAFVLATLLCLPLCGCQALEDMRAVHAVWQEDGSILWNGAVYRKLEFGGSDPELDVSYDYTTIYITEPDVPVLMSEVFGDGMDVCANGALLEYYDYAEGGYVLYCREDVYDQTMAYLENGIKITTYYYEYYDYEAQQSMPYYLTEEQKNTIQRILATAMPVLYDDMDEDWVDCFALYGCDDSHMFGHGVEMWLGVTESRYFIEMGECIYYVPMAYNEIFAEIWKAYDDGIYIMNYPPSVVI